ncbi:hypothetical protein HY643_02505 [Candidatus Woesearchaeota archaeon]|nr:hypothetical protein [Candidatus Woesearchaeota archaeon]
MGLETKLFKKSQKQPDEDFNFEFGPLKITKEAYNKMRRYQQLFETLSPRTEFYAYMVSPKGDNEAVTDVFLAPRQDNVHAHTEVDEEGVGISARAIESNGNRIRGWTHYHPSDGWFFSSGEDQDNHTRIVTALTYNKQTACRKKEYKPTSIQKKEGKISINNEFLGETIEFDAAYLDESKLEELTKNFTFKKDSYKTVLFCYSMILVGDNREYVELITFDTKTKKVNLQLTKIEFVESQNKAAYTDKELLVDLLTRIKYNSPLSKVVRNIEDKKLMIKAWKEVKKMSKEQQLPTELYPKKIFKPIFKQPNKEETVAIEKKVETKLETKVSETPQNQPQKETTDEAIIKELETQTYSTFAQDLKYTIRTTIKKILFKMKGRQI